MTKQQLFNEFIMQNMDGAYRFAYSYVKNHQDAEDIVSQSIIKALSHIGSLKKSEYMKSWFFKILINTALSFLRKKKKVVYLAHEDLDALGSSSDRYQDNDVKEMVGKLPERYREIIILRYFEDFTLQEIARTLDMNLSTVKSHLYKALKLMKLEEEIKDAKRV